MSTKSTTKASPATKATPAPAAAAVKASPATKPAAASAVKKVAKKAAAPASPAPAPAAAPVTAAARPLVGVRDLSDDKVLQQVVLPPVFVAPIRPDIVHFVHTSMSKNHRQAYAVSPGAGHQHSAESWGTGRAVARIPRVSGGGTSRAGQGAFGNMCRAGRMFAPTKTWRKWHRRINTNQKRFAVASALAASALPSLVFARGHQISAVPEIPLVLDSAVESLQRTKQAIAALKAVGAYDDVVKAKASRKLRRGKGKMRDRRHVQRRGPLVVYAEDGGVVKAFRNLPGVELAHVDSLNLLQLAPGGHLGRFVVWSESAFSKLSSIWGSTTRVSSSKKDYTLPRSLLHNSDLTRIINSDEIQSKVRPAIKSIVRRTQKKNPLVNLGARIKLNPYAATLRRSELVAQERRTAAKAAIVEARRKKLPIKKSQDQINRAVANKKHHKQQSINYQRLVNDDFGKPAPVAVAEEKKEE